MILASILALGLAFLLGPGYLLWLASLSRRRDTPIGAPLPWPEIDVIVPVHNEASWIASKVENLLELDYPPERLRFLIVDGASTDGTPGIARDRAGVDPRFRILEIPRADKIAQLNAGLARGSAPWVLVTDCDARLPAETLRRLAAAAPGRGVLGTVCEPDRAQALDRTHWNLHNRVRLAESARGFASLVTAPCYLFRRGLVERFPEDVVGDDVHVTLAAAARGETSALVPVRVVELRSPRGLRELARHKFRKADAYAREILRFAPSAPAMEPRVRAIFCWRAGQLLAFPLLFLFGAACVAVREPQLLVAAAAAIGLLGPRGLRLAALGLLLSGVLATVLLSLPFRRPTACYAKVGPAREEGLLAPDSP